MNGRTPPSKQASEAREFHEFSDVEELAGWLIAHRAYARIIRVVRREDPTTEEAPCASPGK